jgi:hypothetical protein
MLRLAIAVPAAALALAGCASQAEQHPAPPSKAVVTVHDRRGDPVDADGNPRRNRPDVDITVVEVDRGPGVGANAVRFTVVTATEPSKPIRFELFAESPEVDGYDTVSVLRTGATAVGYVAFENATARQRLPAATPNGNQLSFDVPVDPILGSPSFEWRLTASTVQGARISDSLPSPTGTVRFPR